VNFYGAIVTISAGQPGPKTWEVVDDPQFTAYNWLQDSDDSYYWNGGITYSPVYEESTVATYTFQGASAVVLRGLSMFNYGPYTVTLDNQTARFNALSVYWRHAQAILFFAGGLDPAQSHTISPMNYDPSYPDAPSTQPNAVSSAAFDSLLLILDDTASRNAMLATFNGTVSSAPTPASSTSTPAIIAGVLGGLLLLMFVLVIFFVIAWMRIRKEVQTPHYLAGRKERSGGQSLPDSTPWSFEMSSPVQTSQSDSVPLNYVGAPPPSVIHTRGVGREASAQVYSVITPSPASNALDRQTYKRPVRIRPRQDSAERHPSSINTAEQDSDETLTQAGVLSSAAGIPAPRQQRSRSRRPRPEVLGELVNTLSAVLNGHLHEEFFDRGRIEGSEGPPEYHSGA